MSSIDNAYSFIGNALSFATSQWSAFLNVATTQAELVKKVSGAAGAVVDAGSAAVSWVSTNSIALGAVGGSTAILAGGLMATKKFVQMKNDEDEKVSDFQIGSLIAASTIPLIYTGSMIHPAISTAAALIGSAALIPAGRELGTAVRDGDSDLPDVAKDFGACATLLAFSTPMLYTLAPYTEEIFSGAMTLLPLGALAAGYAAGKAIYHSGSEHLGDYLHSRWDVSALKAKAVNEMALTAATVGAIAISAIPFAMQAGVI